MTLRLISARTRLAALAAALLVAGLAAPTRADFNIVVENSVAPAGGTGSFDVNLVNTGGDVNLSAFALELSIPGAAGVLFTGVTTGTTLPYVFSGGPGPPPFSFDTFPNTDFTASDSFFAAPGYQFVASGGTFGLAHVTYSVDPGAMAGPVTVSVVAAGTNFTDDGSNLVGFSSVDGTILVTPKAVPEPSSLMLIGLGGLAAWCLRRRGVA